MKTCDCCGNTYEHAFEIIMGGETHVFDCFECAIYKLAPTCSACGCRIIGHGVQGDGRFFCCAHCARTQDVDGIVDNSDKEESKC